jgi:hypothetical protein
VDVDDAQGHPADAPAVLPGHGQLLAPPQRRMHSDVLRG